MREVSEDEVMEMAGESDCPVLSKEESEEMEAAVCLKQFPQGIRSWDQRQARRSEVIVHSE
jgi:hypothetical protein